MASLVFRNTTFSYPSSPVILFDSIDFGVSEVSHDERFLSKLTDILWEIRSEGPSALEVAIHVRLRGSATEANNG
jgi:hypothetical protein